MSNIVRSNEQINSDINNGVAFPSVGFKNYIINGGFDVWQRGTSFTSEGKYTTDRFTQHFGGTQSVTRLNMTQIRANQIISEGGNPSKYFLSLNVSNFDTFASIRTRIENIEQFSGQTLTLSFYVASENNNNITPFIRIRNTYTTLDEELILSAQTTTQVMSRKSVTFTVPDIYTLATQPDGTGYLEVELYTNGTGWHDYAMIQLEEGSVATPFEQRPIGLELSLCQRYYLVFNTPVYKSSDLVSPSANSKDIGYMRASPSILISANSGSGVVISSARNQTSGFVNIFQSAFNSTTEHVTVALDAEL